MKKTKFSFKTVLILLTLFITNFLACTNKKDFISPIYEQTNKIDDATLVNRFLLETPTTPEKAKKIIADIRKTEKEHPFLANYARKYGFPEWNFMFGSSISPTNAPSQKTIAVGTNSIHTNTTSSNKKSGYYFIPLKDSITKRVKGYIYCQQYNDSTFTYTTYDVDKILASNPQTDTAKFNKHTTLGLASYFEKQINGTEITDEFRTGFYKNVKITEVSNPNLVATNTSINSNGNQIHVVPGSDCVTHNYYFIEFSGQLYLLEIISPCLPEVVVISTPKPKSVPAGGGGGGSITSPSLPPSMSTPPSSGGSSGIGSYNPPSSNNPNPSNPTYGYPAIVYPPDWFEWDPTYRNPYEWGISAPFGPNVGFYPPLTNLYSPTLQSLINTLGLSQIQAEWLNQHPVVINELVNLIQNDEDEDAAKHASKLVLSTMMNNDEFKDEDIINEYNSIHNQNISDPIVVDAIMRYFGLKYATLKYENSQLPISQQKSRIKLLYLTFSDAMHTGLDLLGLIPFGGEVFDVINGLTYTLEGDKTNAVLSYASAIPFAGYAATTVKAIKAGAVIIAVVGKTGKLVAKRVSQKAFSKACGAVGSKVGHHIISFHKKVQEHDIMQLAFRAGFNPNDAAVNGKAIEGALNTGNHSIYADKLVTAMNKIATDFPNMTPPQAKQKLLELIDKIKATIDANPGVHVDNLPF